MERRGTLEGRREGGSVGCVSDAENGRERQEIERSDETDEEDRENGNPPGLVYRTVTVGHEERDQGDNDRCDCDPEPGASLAESGHLDLCEASIASAAEFKRPEVGLSSAIFATKRRSIENKLLKTCKFFVEKRKFREGGGVICPTL